MFTPGLIFFSPKDLDTKIKSGFALHIDADLIRTGKINSGVAIATKSSLFQFLHTNSGSAIAIRAAFAFLPPISSGIGLGISGILPFSASISSFVAVGIKATLKTPLYLISGIALEFHSGTINQQYSKIPLANGANVFFGQTLYGKSGSAIAGEGKTTNILLSKQLAGVYISSGISGSMGIALGLGISISGQFVMSKWEDVDTTVWDSLLESDWDKITSDF